MSKPVILTVDDEPDVLKEIQRDLYGHFRTSYRIVKVGSGAQALKVVAELKQRGSDVALFMVDGAHRGGPALRRRKGERQDRSAQPAAAQLRDRRDPHVA